MDGLALAVGIVLVFTSLPAIFRPQKQHRESLRNRNVRLAELKAGAAESYFEERRELEAYPPKFDPSNRMISGLGVVSLLVGIGFVFWAVIG